MSQLSVIGLCFFIFSVQGTLDQKPPELIPGQEVIDSESCHYDAVLIPMTKENREVILNYINGQRNFVAGGNLKGFSNAAKMNEVVWDETLAREASQNAGKCKLHRNASLPASTGQTVGYHSTREMKETDTEILVKQYKMWFSEHKLASMEDVVSPTLREDSAPHNFLQLMAESTTKVGCGIVRQHKNRWTQTFVSCYYDQKPIKGQQVYETGIKPAEDCVEKSLKFRHLCAAGNNPNGINRRTFEDWPIYYFRKPGIIAMASDLEELDIAIRQESFEKFLTTIEEVAENLKHEEIRINSYNLPVAAPKPQKRGRGLW